MDGQVFEFENRRYLVLETAEQADEMVSDDTLQDALEGWFGERRTVPHEEFLDCISDRYGVPSYGELGFELREYDNPAARRLMSRARKIKRELGE